MTVVPTVALHQHLEMREVSPAQQPLMLIALKPHKITGFGILQPITGGLPVVARKPRRASGIDGHHILALSIHKRYQSTVLCLANTSVSLSIESLDYCYIHRPLIISALPRGVNNLVSSGAYSYNDAPSSNRVVIRVREGRHQPNELP
jgi:hypothetical protein